MGRPRAFDEDEAVRAAVGLFGGRAYDGVFSDDLVTHLGVHRNSLYKTFGSKHGLYLVALRRTALAQRLDRLDWKETDRALVHIDDDDYELTDEHYSRRFIQADDPHASSRRPTRTHKASRSRQA